LIWTQLPQLSNTGSGNVHSEKHHTLQLPWQVARRPAAASAGIPCPASTWPAAQPLQLSAKPGRSPSAARPVCPRRLHPRHQSARRRSFLGSASPLRAGEPLPQRPGVSAPAPLPKLSAMQASTAELPLLAGVAPPGHPPPDHEGT